MYKFSVLVSALAAIAAFGLIWHMLHKKSTRDSFLGTDKAAWVAWKQQFSRSYGTNTEEDYRFGVFKNNLASINHHNSLGKSWEEGLNQFSDLTFDEFSAQYLRTQPDTENVEMIKSSVLQTSNAPTDIPSEWDWRTAGHVVHPVKDQGQCGSCWAFSATGAHESAHAIKDGKSVSLSEQQIVDCDKKDMGCSGGWMNSAFDYIKTAGHHDDTFYPYKAENGTCAYDNTKPLKRLSGYTIVPKHVNDLKAAIRQQPVAVGINGSTIMNYRSGVYDDWWACNFPWPMARINHGVLAVGYGQDYFLIKNSWGSAWGDSGFIKISTYAPSDYINYPVCFTTQKASWPTAA